MLIILTGPTCSGKTTLLRRLVKTGMRALPTITTRPPREDERNGDEIRFVSRRRFESMKKKGALIEWTEVAGHGYGTPKAELEQAIRDGRPALKIATPDGLKAIRNWCEENDVDLFSVGLSVPKDVLVKSEINEVIDNMLFERELEKLKRDSHVRFQENLEELPGINDDEYLKDKILILLNAEPDNPVAKQIMAGIEGFDAWVRDHYHKPSFEEMKRHSICQLLDGFGLEVLREDHFGDPFAEYINMGDPYITTVVWPMEGEHEGVPHIISWGDYLELREGLAGEEIPFETMGM